MKPTLANILYKHTTLVLFFACLFINNLQAFQQPPANGWAHIRNNDFVAAESAFKAQLKENPTNVDALRGLLFVSETHFDQYDYQRYANQLIQANWDEATYLLFDQIYSGKLDDLQAQKDFHATTLWKSKLYVADSLFNYRRMEEATYNWKRLLGNYQWSLIGPFDNLAGSGHIAPYSIEQENYQPTKSYYNENKLKLQWTKRQLYAPWDLVETDKYLASRQLGTYYANTFLEVAEEQTVQLRFSRKSPIKVWLDGELIINEVDETIWTWDNTSVQVKLKPGTHRLLVKISPILNTSYLGNAGSDFSLTFNDRAAPYMATNYYNTYGYDAPDLPKSAEADLIYDFSMRVTDSTGQIIGNISSSFDTKNNLQDSTALRATPISTSLDVVAHYQNAVKADTANWGNYYLLMKAFVKANLYMEGEAYFVHLLEACPHLSQQVYFKYLLAKLYFNTGKTNRAEALLSGLDEARTPMFVNIRQQFERIDQEQDEDEYIERLQQLHQLAPTNWSVITKCIAYYDDKGLKEEKKAFVSNIIKNFPDYTYSLEHHLNDESYKPTSSKTRTDKDRKKAAQAAQKRIKKTFDPDDYYLLIRYYKQKAKTQKAMALYEELVDMLPWSLNTHLNYADYLFENDRFEDALAVLKPFLALFPNNMAVRENIGDIYLEQKDEATALEYYQAALAIEKQQDKLGYYSYSWGSSDLETKINKIKGEDKSETDDLFQSIAFEDVLEDLKDSLAMQAWASKYQDEESVILLHTMEAVLEADQQFQIKQKMLIQILNEAGANYWTEANFSFLGRLISVKVIKKNGKEITPEVRMNYAVFKNLQPGDLIQLEGRQEGNMNREIKNEAFLIVGLSQEAPIYRQKVELITSDSISMNITTNRWEADSATIKTAGNYKIHTWERQFVPKYEQEEAVLDRMDAVSWMMWSTMANWEKVANWYLQKTYRKLELSYDVKAALDTIIRTDMTDTEKVIAVYNYITSDIKYSYVSFLQSNFIPKSPTATLSSGIGDCKDVASLAIAMLRAIGIEAHYVLVKMRGFTDLKPAPSMLFDHVIVGYRIDNEPNLRYMDLTTDYYPYYVIHEGDADAWGLLIKADTKDAFRLPNDHLNPSVNLLDIKIDATLEMDRTVRLDANISSSGLIGGNIRERINGMSVKDQNKYFSQFFDDNVFKNLVVDSLEVSNFDSISSPLAASFALHSDKFLDKVSNLFIFQLPFLKSIGTNVILAAPTRYNTLDLDQLFDITPTVQSIEMEMPAEYIITEIPEDILIDNRFFEYKLIFERGEGGRVLKVKRELMFKERLVQSADYQLFKNAFLEIVEHDGMRLYAIRKK